MRLLGYPGWLLGPLLWYTVWLLRCCYAVARVLWVIDRVPRMVARAVARVHSVVAKVLLGYSGWLLGPLLGYPGWLLSGC